MNTFHFLRPQFLFILIPFIVFLFLFIRTKRQSSIWNKICSKDLLPYVLAGKSKRNYLPYCLIFLAGMFLITALAGPAWREIVQPLIKTQSGLVIALDLSPAMNAADIKPSRLQGALYKLTDILNLRREGQTALIVFTAEPFVVTPLTDDAATIKALLPSLQTNIMPTGGHRAEKAIAKGIELLTQGGIPNGSILLITSELSSKELDKAVALAAKNGVAVSVLGVGSEEGAPIPKQEGGFVKDDKGALILTMLSKDNLSKLAQSTGGTYATISLDEKDSNALIKGFSALALNQQKEKTELQQNQWHDEGYWLVLLAIPFAALYFRKGILISLIILPLFLAIPSLQALSWNDWWETSDQQAEHFFHQKDYQKAKELFQNPDWQGAASYQLGDYEAAAEAFQKNQSAEGYYNLGTAKAKKGDLEEALASYEKAVEIQPDHEDALYNKKIIEEFIQQQEKQNQENKDQNQDKKNQNKDQKNNKDQNQDNQKDENQENSEKKDQDKSQDKNQEKNPEKGDEKNQENKQQQDKDSSDPAESKKRQDESDKKNDPKEMDEKQKKEMQDKLQEHLKDQLDKKIEENKEKGTEKEAAAMESEAQEHDPQRQIDDRWLQKVHDDPGGLLRRKFLQQYQQQNQGKKGWNR